MRIAARTGVDFKRRSRGGGGAKAVSETMAIIYRRAIGGDKEIVGGTRLMGSASTGWRPQLQGAIREVPYVAACASRWIFAYDQTHGLRISRAGARSYKGRFVRSLM